MATKSQQSEIEPETETPAKPDSMSFMEQIENAGATYRETDKSARESAAIARYGIADNRGTGMINTGVNMVVGILVVGLLTAYLLPIAITEIAGVDTSSWGSAEAQLFELLPIFFVIAVVLFVVDKAMKYRS